MKLISKIAAVAVVAISLAACAGQITSTIGKVTKANGQLISDLTAISNALAPDIQNAMDTAYTIDPLSTKPFDAPVGDCIKNGVLVDKNVVDTLLNAANKKGSGLVTDAVVAGVVSPGSKTEQELSDNLGQSCAAAFIEHGVSSIRGLSQVTNVLGSAAVLAPKP